MMDKEEQAFLAFSIFPGIGPMRFRLLYEYFGSAAEAWEAPYKRLRDVRLPPRLLEDFDRFRKRFDMQAYRERLQKEHVSVLPITNSRYPERLRTIPDAPIVLYIKNGMHGEKINLSRAIGIVGARKMTPYGEEMTRRIVAGLVSYGCTIVSGLAYGVDAAAHDEAIRCRGKTVAVLGCGVDIVAPAGNAYLYDHIMKGAGAIVSEMPLGARPDKRLFPARNRIISGISAGVVVTEGAEDSGSLITASYAAEQGREVFAVPGPVTSPMSRAPTKLLKSGAALVESADDIAEALEWEKTAVEKRNTNVQSLSSEERKIVSALSGGPSSVDQIIRASGLTTAQVHATLTILAVKGVLKPMGEQVYGLVIKP